MSRESDRMELMKAVLPAAVTRSGSIETTANFAVALVDSVLELLNKKKPAARMQLVFLDENGGTVYIFGFSADGGPDPLPPIYLDRIGKAITLRIEVLP